MIAVSPYDEAMIAEDSEYIANKLDITVAELKSLMDGPNKSYRDYKSNMALIGLGTKVLRTVGIQRAVMR
jgi:hypothetical protein